jgi:hypothetical protein
LARTTPRLLFLQNRIAVPTGRLGGLQGDLDDMEKRKMFNYWDILKSFIVQTIPK